MAKAVSKQVDKGRKTNLPQTDLKKWNMWLSVVFAVQGIFVLLLSATKLFPVEISYLTKDPIASELAGEPVTTMATRYLFDINLAYMAAGIFFVAALARVATATIYRHQYVADIKKGVNRARWIECALGCGLFFVALALLAGARELTVLVAVFLLAAISYMLRLVFELRRLDARMSSSSALPALVLLTELASWVITAAYLWASGVFGSDGLPVYVYILFGTGFAFSVGCAATMFRAPHFLGGHADPYRTERMYLLLSLAAVSGLVWQIVAGALGA